MTQPHRVVSDEELTRKVMTDEEAAQQAQDAVNRNTSLGCLESIGFGLLLFVFFLGAK